MVVLDGVPLITPENIDPATGLHFERPLPVVFIVKEKDVNMTTTQKGTALQNGINIKSFETGLVLAALSVNQVVYGNKSAGGTDLVDVTHIYASDGKTLLKSLGTSCKVSIGTWLKVESGQDPAEIPAPTPTPSPTTGDIHLDATLKADGTITGTWTNV
jgi:hypothetical protein